MKILIQKFKCFFGFHEYVYKDLGTVKLGFQVLDKVCKHCSYIREWII